MQKPPGVARQLVTFSCFAKEKVTKKKATPVCRCCAVPCVARLVRRLRNSRYALRQSSPIPPDQSALLGGAQGKMQNGFVCAARTICCGDKSGFARHSGQSPPVFSVLLFSSHVHRLGRAQASGGLGEHCSSPAVGRGVCAPPGRVAQPRLLVADRGNPAGAVNLGRLFLGYLLLAKQKKVTSCRAAPDGSAFDLAF